MDNCYCWLCAVFFKNKTTITADNLDWADKSSWLLSLTSATQSTWPSLHCQRTRRTVQCIWSWSQCSRPCPFRYYFSIINTKTKPTFFNTVYGPTSRRIVLHKSVAYFCSVSFVIYFCVWSPLFLSFLSLACQYEFVYGYNTGCATIWRFHATMDLDN